MSTIFLNAARAGIGSRASYWRGQGLEGLDSRASYWRGQGLEGLDSRASYWRGQGLEGLGLAPIVAASAAVPGVGPFLAIGGAVASFFGGLFGGRDDQKTEYRPPADTAARAYEVAGQLISFDLSDLSAARRGGNRDDDIFSYYSAFESGNTSRASDAARRVLENQARENGVSVREQAARILEYAKVKKIVNSFLPSGQGSGGSSPGSLPGYCQPGTYHPYPLGHPRQNECAPFPGAGSSGPGQPGPGQPGPGQPGPGQPQTPGDLIGAGVSILTAAGRRAAQRAQQERLNQACQAGTYFDSTSQRCMPIPICGTGLIFDPLTPGCIAPGALPSVENEMPSWVWLLLIGLGLVLISR